MDINAMDIDTLKATLIGVLAGDLKVKDGALVVPEAPGPRGPTAKVQPRLAACNSAFLEMTSEAATAPYLHDGAALTLRDVLEALAEAVVEVPEEAEEDRELVEAFLRSL